MSHVQVPAWDSRTRSKPGQAWSDRRPPRPEGGKTEGFAMEFPSKGPPAKTDSGAKTKKKHGVSSESTLYYYCRATSCYIAIDAF